MPTPYQRPAEAYREAASILHQVRSINDGLLAAASLLQRLPQAEIASTAYGDEHRELLRGSMRWGSLGRAEAEAVADRIRTLAACLDIADGGQHGGN